MYSGNEQSAYTSSLAPLSSHSGPVVAELLPFSLDDIFSVVKDLTRKGAFLISMKVFALLCAKYRVLISAIWVVLKVNINVNEQTLPFNGSMTPQCWFVTCFTHKSMRENSLIKFAVKGVGMRKTESYKDDMHFSWKLSVILL